MLEPGPTLLLCGVSFSVTATDCLGKHTMACLLKSTHQFAGNPAAGMPPYLVGQDGLFTSVQWIVSRPCGWVMWVSVCSSYFLSSLYTVPGFPDRIITGGFQNTVN